MIFGTMPAPEAWLSLDPSSTCIGYALHSVNFSDPHTIRPSLIDAGRILPDRVKDPANDRIRAMVRDLIKLIHEHRPTRIIIEDTSGKVARGGRQRGMNGAGLAIHGKAVGWVIAVCIATGIEVVPLVENEWTRGQRKQTRQMMVIAAYPKLYDPKLDPGMDTSDAIKLGEYAITMERCKNGNDQQNRRE